VGERPPVFLVVKAETLVVDEEVARAIRARLQKFILVWNCDWSTIEFFVALVWKRNNFVLMIK